MARIRTIKPSFWADPRVVSLNREARLLAVGLISFADDEGRFVASIHAIAGYVFPHDNLPNRKVAEWRDSIAKSGLIDLYCVDGLEYGVWPNWRKHQRISKPQPSILPAPKEGWSADSFHA